MNQALANNPWLIFWLFMTTVVAAVTIACTAIVFITDYLRNTYHAAIDASLKQSMIERGMSAADIKTVLEAHFDGETKRLELENQGVRVGLGRFQIEVGTPKNGAEDKHAAHA
jgi:hypothetical protein